MVIFHLEDCPHSQGESNFWSTNLGVIKLLMQIMVFLWIKNPVHPVHPVWRVVTSHILNWIAKIICCFACSSQEDFLWRQWRPENCWWGLHCSKSCGKLHVFSKFIFNSHFIQVDNLYSSLKILKSSFFHYSYCSFLSNTLRNEIQNFQWLPLPLQKRRGLCAMRHCSSRLPKSQWTVKQHSPVLLTCNTLRNLRHSLVKIWQIIR